MDATPLFIACKAGGTLCENKRSVLCQVEPRASAFAMTPRRIAYVLKVFPKISETFIATELAELRRRGVELRILSLLPPRAGLRHDLVMNAGLEQLTSYEPKDFLGIVQDFGPQ